MSITKHTPIPWHRNIPPATKYTTIFSGRNKHVCRVVVDGLTPEEVEANCNLIIKGVNNFQTMLDALKDALHSGQHACNCGDKCEGTCTFSLLTSAIKKAET